MEDRLKLVEAGEWRLGSFPYLMSKWLTLFGYPNLVRLLRFAVLEAEIVALFPVIGSDDLIAPTILRLLNVPILNRSLR